MLNALNNLSPRLVRGFSLLSAYQKATTKNVVANFIQGFFFGGVFYRWEYAKGSLREGTVAVGG